jgi:hypothetical protein
VATLTALKCRRAELIDAKIAAHQGRIAKLIGVNLGDGRSWYHER